MIKSMTLLKASSSEREISQPNNDLLGLEILTDEQFEQKLAAVCKRDKTKWLC